MAVALITLNLLGNLALGFAFFYGRFRLMAGTGDEAYHFFTGLFAAFLALFAQCMGMFYFIGTGKMIRQAVDEHGLDPGYSAEAHGFKIRFFPVASLAIATVMATPILGGGVHAGRLPVGVHFAAASAALLLYGVSSVLGCRLIWRNLALTMRVEQSLDQKSASTR